jgi:hypothetical protein
MATGDIKTFDFIYNGLTLQIIAIDLGDGKTTFEIKCLDGAADINALYWGDGVADGNNFDLGTKKDNSLNMNGTGEDWDGGVRLSSTGLGSEGTTKPTYLTAGESYTMEGVNLDWNTLDTLGVRATSTSTAGGSIKGVDGDAVVTEVPKICVDDVTVTEGVDANATFTITLDGPYLYDITITYETGNGSALAGSDYTTTTGSVTILAGQTSATVDVPILDDTSPEATETFTITLTGATADIPGEDISVADDIQCAVGTGTILDIDQDPGNPPADHFPVWTQPSISHVTFYFDTADGFVGDVAGTDPENDGKGPTTPDGWFTVKFNDQANPELSDDLDDWVADALAYIETKNPTLDMDTLAGVSIKGGTTEIWYDFDGVPNDVDVPPTPPWIVDKNEVDQAYNVSIADPFTVAL